MILVDNCIVSDEIANIKFACNIAKCKGICCIEGDAGAPLDEEEIGILEDIYEDVKPFLTEAGVAAIEELGSVFDYDIEGHFVTPLIDHKDCAFLINVSGIAKCAIEKAWEEGVVDFQKPISCHLYPIRITNHAQFQALHYHRWEVCKDAVVKGTREGVSVLEFLKTPLIRKFGEEWYTQLMKQIAHKK